MIQEIAPHYLNNSFAKVNADSESAVFTFDNGKVLVYDDGRRIHLPVLSQFTDGTDKSISELKDKTEYVFSVDDIPMFLLPQQYVAKVPEDMEYVNIRDLYSGPDRWMALASVTASHLNHWYGEHRYCGCCGSLMKHSDRERAMICPECGNIQYPRISPVIMAAVTDGDRLLVTRYAGRPYKGLALIAGFVEIGESVEGALHREVMEEVGLKVKNLKYFGSQPWGFSDSVITGFFASLDGSDAVRLDRNELSEAVWLDRSEIPELNNDMSITAAMIEAFRKGEA